MAAKTLFPPHVNLFMDLHPEVILGDVITMDKSDSGKSGQHLVVKMTCSEFWMLQGMPPPFVLMCNANGTPTVS